MSSSHTDRVRVLILGSTGSIGRQTLEVINELNQLAERGNDGARFDVVGLAAGSRGDELSVQARAFNVPHIAIADESAAVETGARVTRGAHAATELVNEVDCDLVVGAVVGVAGLASMLRAIELGRDIALANKETLVAAGEIVIPLARERGSKLLPIDSEHSAVWQCLTNDQAPPMALGPEVERVLLTASGGPFRGRSRDDAYDATPDEALAHPTWSMGPKVTIDSATMTNKALELIEAHWLFGLESERLGVIIHPQSIVHSFVEHRDHSIIAQLGAPDMRTPIQLALTFPSRAPGISSRVDFETLSRLDFEYATPESVPALASAYRVIDAGGVSGAVFNAANESAVEAFLTRKIPFGRITEMGAEAIDAICGMSRPSGVLSVDDLMEADAEARRFVDQELAAL